MLCISFFSVLDIGGSADITALESELKLVYLKALSGFLLIVTEDGKVIYISENVEQYLGILQVGVSVTLLV